MKKTRIAAHDEYETAKAMFVSGREKPLPCDAAKNFGSRAEGLCWVVKNDLV